MAQRSKRGRKKEEKKKNSPEIEQLNFSWETCAKIETGSGKKKGKWYK